MPIEMLWERADPTETLRQRFSFASEDDAIHWVRRLLRDSYDAALLDVDRQVISAHNLMVRARTDAGAVLVKICRLPDVHQDLRARADLVTWLGERGHPVAMPWHTTSGVSQVLREGRSIGVQPLLAGTLLDGDDPAQVRAAGTTLAALHLDMAQWPHARRLDAAAQVAGDRRLFAYPPGAQEWAPADLVRRIDAYRADLPALPDQPIHADFRGANLLTGDGRITGVLDFEEARLAPAVTDLANAICLLGTWYHDWCPLPDAGQSAFLAAYASVRPVSDAERSWLVPLVGWQLISHGWVDQARSWLAGSVA